MKQVFRDCCLQTYSQSGPIGLLALWAITLLDWLKTIIEERLERGTEMSRSKFIRLTGWGLILSAFSLLFGFLASNIDAILGRTLTGSESARYEGISTFLIISGSLLLVLGFVGLLVRFAKDIQIAGKLIVGSGVIFGLISVMGAVGLLGSDSNWVWWVWATSFTMTFVSLSLFGIVSLRQNLLPRWNVVPLFSGIGLPAYFLVLGILEKISTYQVNLDQSIGLVILLMTTSGIFLLGYLIQSDHSQNRIVT